MPICSMGLLQLKKILSSKNVQFGYLKLHGFHGKPLCDIKEWGYIYKKTHTSATNHPKILSDTSSNNNTSYINLVPSIIFYGDLLLRYKYFSWYTSIL